jgi:hypothetical protein
MRNSVHAFLVYILFVALAVLFMILALNYPLGYIWITYEDLLGE